MNTITCDDQIAPCVGVDAHVLGLRVVGLICLGWLLDGWASAVVRGGTPLAKTTRNTSYWRSKPLDVRMAAFFISGKDININLHYTTHLIIIPSIAGRTVG